MTKDKNNNEIQRLKELKSYHILDTEAEIEFDEITKAAAEICGCEISLISFIDESRVWFKSNFGIDVKELEREGSFCSDAMVQDNALIIQDTLNDEKFACHSLVTEAPNFRFYAGVPLISPQGYRLGTLCVIDKSPNHLSNDKLHLLKTLAKQVVSYLELKKKSIESTRRLKEIEFYKNGLDEHAIVVKTDRKGIITYVNDKFCEISKYSREELIGKDHRIINSGTHNQTFFQNLWDTISSGKVWQGEIRNKAKDDSFYWVDTTIIPHTDQHGGISEFLAFRYDITQRKELELLNRQIQDINKIGGWKLNIETMIPDWTEETYKVHELEIGTKVDVNKAISYYAENERERISQHVKDCIENGTPYEGDYEFITAKGNKRWVRSIGYPEFDVKGNVVRIVGTIQDITEAKCDQEGRLRELNEILSSTPSCLKILNREGQLLEINRQGLEIMGAPCMESVYKANVYEVIEESDRPKYIEYNERVCSGTKDSLVYQVVSLSGQKYWLESYGAPYKLQNGETGHIAITNDITEKVLAEQEYKHQKAIAQHQSKLASLGELAAGVGHEINNPLAIVKGYIAVLDRIGSSNSRIDYPDLKKYLDKIEIANERIAKIVKGLTTFSRTDNGELSEFKPIEAIQESHNLIAEIYLKDGIRINLDFPNDNSEYVIKANRVKFQQVIMNLISNAKDAVRNNENKEISITCSFLENNLDLKIKDNGCGIPKEIQDKIYDPFFTTKDVNQGTGIGLSLVHSFVKEMNASLSLKSERENGTEFNIRVPLVNASIFVDQSKSKIESPKTNHYTSVLIAEDEIQIAEILDSMLTSIGCDVHVVHNGEDAYKALKKKGHTFDIVISDMKMPKVDGVQLLHSIRKDNDIVQPKFIFITGGMNVDFESKESEVGNLIDGYLLKPFDSDDIKKLIGQIIDKEKKIA